MLRNTKLKAFFHRPPLVEFFSVFTPVTTPSCDVRVYWTHPEYVSTSLQPGEDLNHWRSTKTSLLIFSIDGQN